MSKLENLTQKIVDDAKKEADAIKASANEKASSLYKNRVKEANDRKEKILEKAALEAEMMKERVVSSAELKIRDEKLVMKHSVLDKVFENAKKELLNLKGQDYLEFVKKSIEETRCSKDSLLKVPKDKVGLLKEIGLGLEVVEDKSLESGFMIVDKDIVYNYNFDSLIKETREEIEASIVNKLFGE